MKTEKEIKNKVNECMADFNAEIDKGHYAYENAMDYTRGWVAALTWAMDKPVGNNWMKKSEQPGASIGHPIDCQCSTCWQAMEVK